MGLVRYIQCREKLKRLQDEMRDPGAEEALLGCCRVTHPSMPHQPRLGAGPELHTPNPLPSLPTHAFSLGPKHGMEPAQPPSLVTEAQHPTIETLCPAKAAPQPGPACLAGEKPVGGKVGRQAGGGGSRTPEPGDPSLPSQVQGSQGCCPAALDGVAPAP